PVRTFAPVRSHRGQLPARYRLRFVKRRTFCDPVSRSGPLFRDRTRSVAYRRGDHSRAWTRAAEHEKAYIQPQSGFQSWVLRAAIQFPDGAFDSDPRVSIADSDPPARSRERVVRRSHIPGDLSAGRIGLYGRRLGISRRDPLPA